MRGRLLLSSAAAFGLALLLARLAGASLGSTLYAPRFLGGWLLASAIGLLVFSWWSPPTDLGRLTRRARRELALAALVLGLFAFHVEGLPHGWTETLLFVLFLGLMASTCVGAVALGTGAPSSERRAELWLCLHVPLLWVILALGFFHGAFVHLHGLLAHVFLHGEAGP